MDLKKKLSLSEDACELFDDIPGGGYLAELDETGEHWSVRDVPFFSELPAGTKKNEQPISREWMEAVLLRHRELESEQKHLPAVHAHHHGDGRETFRIGFLRPTRVGLLTLDGQPRWTLFGDIIRIEDHHFEQIKNMRYPYRSAEIGRDWKPEISSMALLEDEAPHFKLPMLTIGEERRHFDREFEPSKRPAVAFSEVGESAYICFSFKGSEMPKTVELTKKVKLAEHSDDKNGDGDKDKLQDKDKVAEGIVKVIAEFQEGLPALVASILQGLLPPTDRKVEGETQVEPAMLKERLAELLKAKTDSDSDTKNDDLLGELRGQVAGLQEKEKLRETVERSDGLADAAIQSLRDGGWNLSEEVQKAVRSIAKESESALKSYVDGFTKTMPKDPPKTLEAAIFKEESPEMAKYKTMSPEKLEAANSLSQQYDELKESGADLRTSREEFVDINLEVLTA